jgi:glucans biosynthesis protein C
MSAISTLTKPRLYYLDWLRVLAFGLLVIENCAEIFSGNHWWIENKESNPLIAKILIFFRQWRMPLLFIISGMAVSIILKKKTYTQFIDDRFTRIFVPLISGMVLVIPPMIYFIGRAKGMDIPFQQFYLNLLNFEWFPKGNLHWLHLWYLPFVFIFSISLMPVIKYFQTDGQGEKFGKAFGIFKQPAVLFPTILLLHLPYYISKALELQNDFTSLLYYFPYFFFGAMFFSNPEIRQTILKLRLQSLYGGLICSIILYSFVWLIDEASGTGLFSTLVQWIDGPLYRPLVSLNQWFWVLAISGFAMQYLNFSNSFLTYANKIVYPFYILHQTFIIAFAYYIVQADASILVKYLLILTAAALSILVLYELLLKRITVLKLMFGIKTNIHMVDVIPLPAYIIGKLKPIFSRIISIF